MKRRSFLLLGVSVAVSPLPAQTSAQRVRVEEAAYAATDRARIADSATVTPPATGRGDREHAKRLADASSGFRLVISLDDRTLWVLRDNDTVRTASVGVASGLTLDYAGRKWTFRTPRGKHSVVGSRVSPAWTPPDWAYAETASQYKLKLSWLSAAQPVQLRDGRRLTVQANRVGVIGEDGVFRALPRDEHIVFESTLFVPPYGTVNRRVEGQLGPYAIDLGGGYLLHGSPSDEAVSTSTHGCIRLTDADLEWLYRNVDLGTPVFIY